MIRFIYFLLAGCLATGCIQQANTTHSNQESASPTPVNTSIQTESISNNLQSPKVNSNREITTFPFINDTLETVLSSRSIKTFLSKDEKEIVEYNIIGSRDTVWYNGIKANAIISNCNQGDRADTIIITRSLLAKHFHISDIEKYMIASVNYEFEKGDTICFSIALTIPDSDIGFDFKYYHTNLSDYITQDLIEEE